MKKVDVITETNNEMVVRHVKPGQSVVLRFGGATVTVLGYVDGVVRAHGGGATVVVHGDIGPDADIEARGGGAKIVTLGHVDHLARLVADGANAKVVNA